MTKPLAEIWYGIDPLADGIVRLRELPIDPYLSGNIWLVQWRERDLLVDCGTGMVSPRPVAEAIARKPVLAVALNRFYDHAGGLHAFDQRACHPLEAEAITNPTDQTSLVTEYVSDDMLSALPCPGYSTRDYHMVGAPPTLLLDEGVIIDLGDRRLQVLHVPGVTPGSLALWEAATGALFTGDTLFDPQEHATCPRADRDYRASLARLRALPVKTVFSGHYDPFERATLERLIDQYLRA